VRQGWI